VGQANYDLGHVLGTNSGGVAYVGVICNNDDNAGDALGPLKGGGASGVRAPVGNSGSVGLWAHELGHQFGAEHTQNANTGGCGVVDGSDNRSEMTAYEPGSGSTIMSYAGLCAAGDNVTDSKDLRFDAGS